MLRAVFYSEFDNDVGPQVACQFPDKYLSPEVFDGVSDYVITKPQLCGKLVTITVSGHKIMGYPLRVRNERYHRYALMFNVGMVFDEGADTRAYQGVLRKLGNTFHTMETESSFLLDPEKKARLRDILPAILNGLRAFGEVALPVDAAHTLFLRIFEFMPPPPPIADHEVPVFVRPFPPYLAKAWDLTLQLIVPCVDGINYVRRIADLTGVAVDLVTHALRQLLYFGYIAVIDIFQYSNVYATCPRIAQLASDTQLQRECVQYVCRARRTAPAPSVVFAAYSAFQAGVSIKEVCTSQDLRRHHVDDRRFVAFGVIHGFIRRVHEYPVPLLPLSELLQPRPFPVRSRKHGAGAGAGAGAGSSGAGGATKVSPRAALIASSWSKSKGGQLGNGASLGGSGKGSQTPGGVDSSAPSGVADGSASAASDDAGAHDSGSRGASVDRGAGADASTDTGSRGDEQGSSVSGRSERKHNGPHQARDATDAVGAGAGASAPNQPSVRLLRLCDGTRSVDDICCMLLRSRDEVMKEIEGNRHFVVVSK